METALTQILAGLPGVVFPFAGPTAPSGWLLCHGQSVLRADYPKLYSAIGTTYGSADGSHFNLPDMRGRVPGGKDDMGGSSAGRLSVALNGNTTSGSATVSTISSTANLAIGMKVVGSGIPDGTTIATIASATSITLSANATATASAVPLRFSVVDGTVLGDASGSQIHKLVTAQMPGHTHTINASINSNRATSSGGSEGILSQLLTTSTVSAGGDQAHPNVQPTIILNYIIKT